MEWLGYLFGLMGFIFGLSASEKVSKLEKKLEAAGVFDDKD